MKGLAGFLWVGTVSSISCYAAPERHQGAFHTGSISGSTGLNANVRTDRPKTFGNKPVPTG